MAASAGRARCRDDRPQLPTLSLGLSSVQFIVDRIEAECSRVVHDDHCEVTGREIVKYDPHIDEGYHDNRDYPLGPPRDRVWNRLLLNFAVAFSRCIPSVSFGNFGVLAVLCGLCAPKMISYLVVYPFCRLVFGTLYPAYASYKAVRTKNIKEYVKWMMYWIVFALFTCTETFTDVFLSWFPFYYEVKIVLVLWLLSPATKGSSILYRRFVHPALCRREQEIDEYIAKAKDQGYHTVLNLGTKGVNYATTVIMQTAIKGGGGLVQQLRKSYSLSDLTECEPREERSNDEADDVLAEPRVVRRGGKTAYSTRRSASESNSRSPMYFPEVDVDLRTSRTKGDEPDFSHIKSSEDISSGYSSADNSASLTRTASLGASARAKARTTRTNITAIKRPQAAEESEVIIEELYDDESFEYTNMPPLVNLPSPVFLSQTDPPFLYRYVGDQVKILQVLGNYPVRTTQNNETNDTDPRDKTDTIENVIKQSDIEIQDKNEQCSTSDSVPLDDSSTSNSSSKIVNDDNNDSTSNVLSQLSASNSDSTDDQHSEAKLENNYSDQKPMSATNIENTNFESDSAESDDEASFGTPEDSPRSKRKSPKGKYGKAKAPPPPHPNAPKIDVDEENNDLDCNSSINSEENLNDIINQKPNIVPAEGGAFKAALKVVNPITENKRRHKSKSPVRIPKSTGSGIGKLLQLPNKLAFWHKTEEKSKVDNISTSSADNSRRSSTMESPINESQSCADLNELSKMVENDPADDMTSFKDATDESDIISNNILEKSDALQKLIEAKIVSHPEYKFVSLHEEIPTTSKSTDV